MRYHIHYFNPKVRADIERWPASVLADYARLIELLMDFGPAVRMPHSRALGQGLFELRARGADGIGRAFYCFIGGQDVVVRHSMVKKSRAIPSSHLRLARGRMKEIMKCRT